MSETKTINRVIDKRDNTTLLDLTPDTVTERKLMLDETAHNREGEPIRGEMHVITDYSELDGKPVINGVTVEGNKTGADYHLIDASEKGEANGLATLNESGQIPSDQLPSYVDSVVNGYRNSVDGLFYLESTFETPIGGEDGIIYVDLLSENTYRWSGSIFVEISKSLSLGETEYTAYAGNKGKANADAIEAIQNEETQNPKQPIALENTLDIGGLTRATVEGALSALNEHKVDKVEGKGLSTEDFTTEEKERLAGVKQMVGATSLTPGEGGLVPTPTPGDNNKVLFGNGHWDKVVVTQNDEMEGATASTNGAHGLVPAPQAGEQNNFLKGDGTWSVLPEFQGVSGSSLSISGLVPPAQAGDENKVLKGDGTWGNVSIDSSIIATEEIISTASRDYYAGDEFIYEGDLYVAITLIAQGDPIVTEGVSANCTLADNLTIQINRKQNIVLASAMTIGGQTVTEVEPALHALNNKPSGSGGHTIVDSDGRTYPARAKLKFVNATVTDDSTNDTTIVEAEGGGGGTIVVTPTVTNIAITYDGTQKSPTITRDTDHTYIQGDYEATNYGTYTFTIGLSGVNDVWSDNTTAPKTYTWSINYDGGTITPVNDIQTWLKCANIDDKAYTTLSEVLADHETLYALINNNNAMDYLVRSTDWVSGITADETAMEYIGHKNYASDTLLNDSTWLTGICNSTYMEKVLNTKVPTMTSDTMPSGEVLTNAASPNLWTCFDGNLSTQGAVRDITSYPVRIIYKFLQPVCVRKFYYNLYFGGSGNPQVASFKIQGSNDNLNWIDLSNDYTTLAIGTSEYTEIINNSHSYLYYAVAFNTCNYKTSENRDMCYTNEIQFYGRTDVTENVIDIYSTASDTVYYMDNGSPVIVCTTDTTGHGTVSKSSLPNGTYTLYSTVAKDPDNLSNDYSKSVTIADNTLEIDLMPVERSKMLYWYGYKISDTTAINVDSTYTLDEQSLSFNTNNATITLPTSNMHERESVFNQNVDLENITKHNIIVNNVYYQVEQQPISFANGYVWIHCYHSDGVAKVIIAISKLFKVFTASDNEGTSQWITGNSTSSRLPQSSTLSALWLS